MKEDSGDVCLRESQVLCKRSLIQYKSLRLSLEIASEILFNVCLRSSFPLCCVKLTKSWPHFGCLNKSFLIPIISCTYLFSEADDNVTERRKVMVRLVFKQELGFLSSLGLASVFPASIPALTLTHFGALNRWQARQDYPGPLPRKTSGTGRMYEAYL